MRNSIPGPEVVSVAWIRQLIHDDPKGDYVAFSLNTRYSLKELIKKWERYCPQSTFVHLIPAYSSKGRLHYHGLCRFPKSDKPWVAITIRESKKAKIIQVPELLRRMLKNLNTQNPESTFGDLHLMNDGQRVKLLAHKSEAADAVLGYWLKTSDGEIRDVNSGISFPHANRQKIHVRKGRAPKVKPLFRRSRPHRDSAPNQPSLIRREEVDAFLARGGVITRLPPVEVAKPTHSNGIARGH